MCFPSIGRGSDSPHSHRVRLAPLDDKVFPTGVLISRTKFSRPLASGQDSAYEESPADDESRIEDFFSRKIRVPRGHYPAASALYQNQKKSLIFCMTVDVAWVGSGSGGSTITISFSPSAARAYCSRRASSIPLSVFSRLISPASC